MSSVGLTIAPAWGITYADSSTPYNSFKPYYGANGVYATVYKYPWPGRGPQLKRENGNYVGVTGYSNQNDHHTIIVRRSDCEFFETYDDRIDGETFTCHDGVTKGCNVNSVNLPYGFGSSESNNGPYAMPSGTTDAAGLPLAPLSWHLDEVKSGSIKHAVRFTASVGFINGAIWPATTMNAASPGGAPYGSRFILKTHEKGGPDLNATCTPVGGSLNVDCVTMLTALQQYGMMLADIGTNNEIQAFTDLTEDSTTRAALKLIAHARIPITAFYAVDEDRLKQTNAEGYTSYENGSYGVDPLNGYVKPVSSSVVLATTGYGITVKLPVAIQGSAIGLKSNELTIAAGVTGYQIPSWVNPSSTDQSVAWSLLSGVGSVTTGGLYTPPVSTIAGNSAVLKVTSVADPNVVNYLYVKVLSTDNWPVGGTIRIDSASETSTVDGYGRLWNSESGVEASLPTQSAPDYPKWPGLEGTQYGTVLYTRGGDIAYSMVVPNGNYKVRLMYGQIFNGNSSQSSYSQSLISNPAQVETQGEIVAHNFDWNAASGYLYQKAADAFVPARVTDNLLVIRTMVSTPDTAIQAASGIGPLYPGLFPYFLTSSGFKSSAINGLEIVPDSSAPHWSIDSQGATLIVPGQSIQLYNIDWYTGVNDPSWMIAVGPPGASINATGLLSLAPGTLTSSRPIVVVSGDGKYSATLLLNTPASINQPGSGGWGPPPVSRSPYNYVRALTIAHAQVNTEQKNFPFTIRLMDPLLKTVSNGGHVLNNNGYDIVLATDAAGRSPLNWEVEHYDPTTGQWIGHVQLPEFSNIHDTTIYMLYGNPQATASLGSVIGSVWDSNYDGVYHFASPSELLKDSTMLGLDGTPSKWGYTIDGLIGGAANVTGGTASLPLKSILNSGSGTIELWINSSTPEDRTHNGILFEQDLFSSTSEGFWFGWSAYWNDFEVNWKSGGNISKMSASAEQMPILPGTWNQIAYTWDRNLHTQNLYLNGQPVISSLQAFGNPHFSALPSFSVPYNPSYYGFSGLIDEARFSSIARSPDWIKAEVLEERSGNASFSLGPEQAVQNLVSH